ncbi:hypothetical protein L211DRAFT_843287 [Terfezia boudieri ATCC MYA-4762]|uniref:Uncharacterized protein n=1 Tax=Terfezia boudieri ATCC MYA-4762 TaxID=1051890 RepID=A0A3N4L7B1_9PEZI|nr:hypothetical protein L211DRAFT_843287 [Terfezia boudieri ATCC MYA-4762]
MSEAMIPISTDALHYFNMETIPAEKFGEIWLYVDSVYASLSGEVLQCKSGTATVGFENQQNKVREGKIIKRRNSSIQDHKHLCHVRIKVS